MRSEMIHITKAVPAKRLDIIKWLITGGKYGKLFVPKIEPMTKYHADLDVNCRCSFKPITVKDVPAPRKDWAIKPEDVGTVKVVDIKGGE